MRETLRPFLRAGEVLPELAKHATAKEMAPHLQGLRIIGVQRDPVERMHSYWCLIQRDAKRTTTIQNSGWRKQIILTAELPVHTFVRQYMRRWPGGFWQYHCCHNGHDFVTDPWPFEEIPQRWLALAKTYDLPPLLTVNKARHGAWQTVFSDELVAEIRNWDPLFAKE
jgi:hypothetical protein